VFFLKGKVAADRGSNLKREGEKVKWESKCLATLWFRGP
jgi:hypothetical protein